MLQAFPAWEVKSPYSCQCTFILHHIADPTIDCSQLTLLPMPLRRSLLRAMGLAMGPNHVFRYQK